MLVCYPPAMARRKRVGFVTIGQSPRDDMLPEMLERIGRAVEPIEVGALVSRLCDGREVTLGKTWTRQRLVGFMKASIDTAST